MATWTEALRSFIRSVEEAGVLVMISGIVGSNTQMLAPLEAVKQVYDAALELPESLQTLARRFKVSTLVILRRLFDADVLDHRRFRETYRTELERLKKMDNSGGGKRDFYNTLSARAGKRFVQAVQALVASTLEGHTPFTDAFWMLGIRKTATFHEEAKRLGLAG